MLQIKISAAFDLRVIAESHMGIPPDRNIQQKQSAAASTRNSYCCRAALPLIAWQD